MNSENETNLIACRVCGVIMVRLARDTCPKCFQEEEKIFQKVRDFLRANNGASLEDVAIHTGCSIEQVEGFLRSGRLERVGVKKVAHPCQLCQKIIYEGVVCPDCRKNLKEQVTSLKSLVPDSENAPATSGDKDALPTGGRKGSDDQGHVGKRQR